MNQAKYDSLPPDLKKVIDANSGIEVSKMIGKAFERVGDEQFMKIVAAKLEQKKEIPAPVLKELDPPDDVEIIGIVMNEKGAERAIATEAVKTLGCVYSISETFLQKNQNQSCEEALEIIEKLKQKADEAGLGVVVYISMAFGNPYGDHWDAEEVTTAAGLLSDMDIHSVSLADTVGVAGADQMDLGVHVHSRREDAATKVLAAYDAGCRRLDSAIGGLGGCPFAQDELVGNIPTEIVLQTLKARGVAVPSLKSLDKVLALSADIAAEYSLTT